MSIVFNGTTLKWYTHTIKKNSSTVSSPTAVGSVVKNGTKVFGLNSYWKTHDTTGSTSLKSFGLAPDSLNLENAISDLLNNYSYAIQDSGYETGPGGYGDTRWYVKLYEGYHFDTSDGTFWGGDSNTTTTWNSKSWTCYLWEGITVTGANTSHNGGTSVDLRRNNGV